MSRTTQYIGLTDDAKAWVKKALVVKEIPNMTTGMFGEEVSGNEYDMPVPTGPNKKFVAVEEVQIDPWSSGPMIFTHLHLYLYKTDNQTTIDLGFAFSWVMDPGMENEAEYNPATGHYNV